MDIERRPATDLPDHVSRWINRTSLLGSVPFARLWESVGGRAVYWLIGEGDRVRAMLPGVEFGRGRLTRFQAMPDGLYGTVRFLEGGRDYARAGRVVLEGLAGRKYARIFVNDFHCDLPGVPGYIRIESTTTLVDVSPEDWQPPDQKLRSEIRKAEREGVEVIPFGLNRHFDDFIRLMKHTEARHRRSPKYPERFFRELAKLAMIDDRVLWQVVEHEGQMAASHIYLVEGEMLLNWQVYFDKQFSFLKPNQYIMFSTVRDTHRRGVTTLNLGAIPGDADSLAYYKNKWGGTTHTYRGIQRRTLLGRLL